VTSRDRRLHRQIRDPTDARILLAVGDGSQFGIEFGMVFRCMARCIIGRRWLILLIVRQRGESVIIIRNVLGPVPGVDVMAKRPQGLLDVGDSFRADADGGGNAPRMVGILGLLPPPPPSPPNHHHHHPGPPEPMASTPP
jgi:hypothetical protein